MGTCTTHRTLLVLVSVLLGVIAALVTAILIGSSGTDLASAVLGGGGAFFATVPLALLIEKELGLFAPGGTKEGTN
jgi:hypothetical protein